MLNFTSGLKSRSITIPMKKRIILSLLTAVLSVMVTIPDVFAATPKIMLLPAAGWCLANGYSTDCPDGTIADYRHAFCADQALQQIDSDFQQNLLQAGAMPVDPTLSIEMISTDLPDDCCGITRTALIESSQIDLLIEISWQATSQGKLNCADYTVCIIDPADGKERASIRSATPPSLSPICVLLRESLTAEFPAILSKIAICLERKLTASAAAR